MWRYQKEKMYGQNRNIKMWRYLTPKEGEYFGLLYFAISEFIIEKERIYWYIVLKKNETGKEE